MRIAFSIDVESQAAGRIEDSVEFILDALALRAGAATFFFVGETAARYPAIVNRVCGARHEVACHGYRHLRLERHDAASLRQDLSRAKALLEDIAGDLVVGYRAPFLSLNAGTLWAADVICECGFVYDSSCSVLPLRCDLGTSSPLGSCRFGNGLIEIPVGRLFLGPVWLWPFGGGFFRHLGYGVSRRLLRAGARRGVPPVFYTHSHELAPTPRGFGLWGEDDMHRSWLLRLRRGPLLQTRNCGAPQRRKIQQLLGDFDCCAMRDLLPL